MLPQCTLASNILAGMVFRAANRRQLRIHMSHMSNYNLARARSLEVSGDELGRRGWGRTGDHGLSLQLSASVVLMQPHTAGGANAVGDNLHTARQYFEVCRYWVKYLSAVIQPPSRPFLLYHQRIVGASVQVLTVWDEPVANYVAHALAANDDVGLAV